MQENNVQDSFLLPPQDQTNSFKKTLVLDLDETLVHSQFEETELANYILNIKTFDEIQTVFVIERPGLKNFLNTMVQYYELILFTSGQQTYAEQVLKKIDPQNQFFSHCLFRQHCIKKDFYYAKDLSLLGRELSDVIIIDNSIECFSLQPENGFLIKSFYDDLTDDELNENLEFFIQLSELEDVREVEYWKEQFDLMFTNEQAKNNNNSLNEIVEDSQEKFFSVVQSQTQNLNSIENQDQIDEIKEMSVIEKDFVIEPDLSFQKPRPKRRSNQSKTVLTSTYHLIQDQLLNRNLNHQFDIKRLSDISQYKLLKAKSFGDLKIQRNLKREQQGMRVDKMKYEKSEQNVSEEYQKHSQIFFI